MNNDNPSRMGCIWEGNKFGGKIFESFWLFLSIWRKRIPILGMEMMPLTRPHMGFIVQERHSIWLIT